MSPALKGFSEWLAATMSTSLQEVGWLVPAVQTVHILAIAAAMASVSMITMRLVGGGAGSQASAHVSARFVPWIWSALAVLALSGALLIVVEPARPLTNPVFFVKLALIGGVAALTLVIWRPLRVDSLFWERTQLGRLAGNGIAIVSWTLWTGVICAGRWIAYTMSL